MSLCSKIQEWIIETPGIIKYQEAFEYQQTLVKRKHQGDKTNYFLLLEHFETFTRGKGSNQENILDKTIPVHIINRGGDLSFHEPGQIIGYLILDLKKEKLNIKTFISRIQDLLIDSVENLGVKAYKHPEHIGVWTENKKIASIGIGIKKGVTMHGFALNVNNPLTGFKKINPCGLAPEIMCSLEKILNRKVSLETVQNLIIEEFKASFLKD
jgi:lipoate-protein ligase B